MGTIRYLEGCMSDYSKSLCIFMHLTIIIFNHHSVVPLETNRLSRDLLVSRFQFKEIYMEYRNVEPEY